VGKANERCSPPVLDHGPVAVEHGAMQKNGVGQGKAQPAVVLEEATEVGAENVVQEGVPRHREEQQSHLEHAHGPHGSPHPAGTDDAKEPADTPLWSKLDCRCEAGSGVRGWEEKTAVSRRTAQALQGCYPTSYSAFSFSSAQLIQAGGLGEGGGE